MIVLAHRGASGHAPENTMAAFRRALALGADGVELDVQLASDGEVVVLHDRDVRRTSDGRGIAAEMDLEALRRLDFGGWRGAAFRGERIPLLSEVVELAADSGMWLNIELKGFPRVDLALVDAVAGVVGGRLDPERTILSSFDASALDEAALRLPDLPRALLVEILDDGAWRRLARKDDRGRPFYRYLHPEWRIVDAASLARARADSIRVIPWTLDRPGPLARMLSLGVDGVITGFPERAAGR